MTNVVVVKGCLSRPASERVMPSGDRLALLDVTVPGAIDAEGKPGRSESVPAAWFGAPAWLLDLEAGTEVVLVGRVRKRFFQSGGLQSRTEVVVDAGAPARRAAKVADLLQRAAETVASAAGAGTATRSDPGEKPRARRTRARAAPTFP